MLDGIDSSGKSSTLSLTRSTRSSRISAESYLREALRYFEEGEDLMYKNPVQAGESLYKAAEESVKALAVQFKLRDVLEAVEKAGEWTPADLEKAVARISEKIGEWFRSSWDSAIALKSLAREAGLSSQDLKSRLSSIEKIVREAQIRVMVSLADEIKKLIEITERITGELSGKIDRLSEETRRLEGRYYELREVVDKSVEELKKGINDLSGAVERTRGELIGEIEKSKLEVGGLKGELETLRSQISELQTRASKLEEASTQLSERLNNLSERANFAIRILWPLTIAAIAAAIVTQVVLH
jgi:chromosome segregation ATPase